MRHQQLSQPKCLALHRCDKMSHVTRLFLRTAGVAEADSLQYAKCKEPSRLRPRWERGCSQIRPGGPGAGAGAVLQQSHGIKPACWLCCSMAGGLALAARRK